MPVADAYDKLSAGGPDDVKLAMTLPAFWLDESPERAASRHCRLGTDSVLLTGVRTVSASVISMASAGSAAARVPSLVRTHDGAHARHGPRFPASRALQCAPSACSAVSYMDSKRAIRRRLSAAQSGLSAALQISHRGRAGTLYVRYELMNGFPRRLFSSPLTNSINQLVTTNQYPQADSFTPRATLW